MRTNPLVIAVVSGCGGFSADLIDPPAPCTYTVVSQDVGDADIDALGFGPEEVLAAAQDVSTDQELLSGKLLDALLADDVSHLGLSHTFELEPGTVSRVAFDPDGDPALCPTGDGLILPVRHTVIGESGPYRFEQTRTLPLYADGADADAIHGADAMDPEGVAFDATVSEELHDLVVSLPSSPCGEVSFSAIASPTRSAWAETAGSASLEAMFSCEDSSTASVQAVWCDEAAPGCGEPSSTPANGG